MRMINDKLDALARSRGLAPEEVPDWFGPGRCYSSGDKWILWFDEGEFFRFFVHNQKGQAADGVYPTEPEALHVAERLMDLLGLRRI